MTLDEKRALIRKVVDAVFVGPGHGTAAQRVTVCRAGTAPRNLPGAGVRRVVPRTITPRRGWINPATD